jgi:hypothetical protein
MSTNDQQFKNTLGFLLKRIVEEDQNYGKRLPLVYSALYYAQRLGYPCGIRLDPEQPGWPVAFIELPTGQVSWHIPQYPAVWDGHSTQEKFRRIAAFAKGRDALD